MMRISMGRIALLTKKLVRMLMSLKTTIGSVGGNDGDEGRY